MLGRFDTAETDQVAELLERAGFNVASPNDLKSKNPDLLVSGREPRFWSEVKSLSDPPQLESFELARVYLAPRLRQVPCAVDLFVSEQARHKEYKLLLRLITRALATNQLPSFALLADAYEPMAVHTYTLQIRLSEPVSIFGHLNAQQKIVVPWQIGEPVFGQPFVLRSGDKSINNILRSYSDECALGAHLYRYPPHTGLVSTTHSRGMWASTNQTRLRRDVSKANQQIAAACKLEKLPGVLFLVGRTSLTTFLTAVLGDAMIPVPSTPGEASIRYYGKNGAFRRNQNTHVSAAYLLSGDDVFFLANPFAQYRIDNFLPKARVITIDEYGNVSDG